MSNQTRSNQSQNQNRTPGKDDPQISEKEKAQQDANRDPLSGRAGAHPVGTGLGAAAGGAVTGVATGAAIGTVAGPVGTAVGAAVGAAAGAIAGGLAGKAVAEAIDPTVEHGYWRDNYATRPYYDDETTYDEFAPAYQYGWESQARYSDREFDDVETDLARDWDSSKGESSLSWDRAKEAVKDAWNRVAHRGSDAREQQPDGTGYNKKKS